jgi:acid phosphatase (class A)
MQVLKRSATIIAGGVALTLILLTAVGGHAAADEATPSAPMASEKLKGYLEKPLDSAALLPPPPAGGSAAEALDQEIARASLALRDTPRWKLAAMDADLRFPWAAGDYSCALGTAITEQDTPRLYTMLRRIMIDAGAATGAAKNKYLHARPFMLDSQPTCSPGDEAALRGNGSYPSGHTSIGAAWALALAEAAPDQAEAILARGQAFGDSRIVCNVHWNSDVIEGWLVGSATVARLHSEPEFLADLRAAEAEIAAAPAKGLAPQRDCKFETDALSVPPLETP